MVFERATEYPTTEEHIWTPDPALGLRLLEAHRRGLLPRRPRRARAAATRSAARSTPTGPARCPRTSPGIAHVVPDLIRKSLRWRRGPLPIFGDGKQTRTLTHVDDIADGIVTATASPAGPQRGLQHLRLRRADRRRASRADLWEACGRDPEELAFEHLPSFDVDVVRRWPSVEKARRPARLGGADRRARGDRPTVAWLRDDDAAERVDIDCCRPRRSGSVMGMARLPVLKKRRPQAARRPPRPRSRA